MKTVLESLKEFENTLPDVDHTFIQTLMLRRRLITEEYEETIEAIDILVEYLFEDDKHDPVKIEDCLKHLAKELSDITYVTYGTSVKLGIDQDKAFDIVHESNMKKIATGSHREDGKLVKGDGYVPPDLTGAVADSMLIKYPHKIIS